MLEAADLSFSYPGKPPLFSGLNLTVEPGERIAIAGGNGSGKSTLLRCLAGLTTCEGRLRIDGLDPSNPAERGAALARIGFLFESPEEQALAPTVEREIAFGLENRGVDAAEMRGRVAEALARFGLSGLESRHPATLSGGERQRLALASVFVEEPRYLFLDEPASRLDAAGREELRGMIEALDPRPAILEATLRRSEAESAGRVVLLSPEGARELSAGEGARFFPEMLESAGGVEARPAAPARKGEILLQARGLVASIPGSARPLFGPIDAGIEAGAALVVVGPTASGKTTLLRILAGFEKPSSGRLEPCNPLPRIAFMPQFPERLLFAPTVLQDVAFAAERWGASRPDAAETARSCLRRVLLDPAEFGRLFPGDLSYGEKRRVALAGLLSGSPRMLLLDEPEVGLDARGRHRFRVILDALLNEGVAAAVTTHDPGWLSGICGMTLVLTRPDSRTVAVE